MLVDYLRYLAFNGRLRPFFEKVLFEYVNNSDTTGQHLRFAPDYLDKRLRSHGQEVIHDLFWNSHSKDLIFERLKNEMGLVGGHHAFALPSFRVGGPPLTFIYKELRPPELEIIIDIEPDHWKENYSEHRVYENIPIIYRKAGPAKANFKSGDRLFDRQRSRARHGTLCGVFCTTNGPNLALTCGHVVAGQGSQVLVEQFRRIWKFRLWSTSAILGDTRFLTMCGPSKGICPVQTQLDAALIEIHSPFIASKDSRVVRQATLKPISTILQEEPVRFRGAGRIADTLARVSAVTVRKSIVYKDGQLRDVGDVLMLGHRHPMYIVQPVSRPGDSGAAVRQDFSSVGPFTELNQWHGMILGGDEAGAYATYAEHLWAWVAQQIGDPALEFVFEL
jgi:hypothetical protein